MKVSNNCINLIKQFEGCKLTSYLDCVGVPTIGYGSTFYLDGTKVQLNETITQEEADNMLLIILQKFENFVSIDEKTILNQKIY